MRLLRPIQAYRIVLCAALNRLELAQCTVVTIAFVSTQVQQKQSASIQYQIQMIRIQRTSLQHHHQSNHPYLAKGKSYNRKSWVNCSKTKQIMWLWLINRRVNIWPVKMHRLRIGWNNGSLNIRIMRFWSRAHHRQLHSKQNNNNWNLWPRIWTQNGNCLLLHSQTKYKRSFDSKPTKWYAWIQRRKSK